MGIISQNTVIRKCLDVLKVLHLRLPVSDRYAKKLTTGKLVTLMVEAYLNNRTSLFQISEHLESNTDLKQWLDLPSIHSSSIHRKLEAVPTEVLESLFLEMAQQVQAFADEYVKFPDLGKLHIVDSSELHLPSVAGKWAYVSKDKNAVKMHVRLAVCAPKLSFADRVIASTAAVADDEVAMDLVMDPEATYLLDRGYINYEHYRQWTLQGIRFVARIKTNSRCRILFTRPVPEGSHLLLDADVELRVPKTDEAFTLRLVEFQDTHGKRYRVLTSRWDITAEQVSELYRARWKIELYFKWLKQHLPTVKLFNHKPQAVWNQIFLALITHAICEWVQLHIKATQSLKHVLDMIRLYAYQSWDRFLEAIRRPPSRASKGRQKKGKRGRPRKHPETLKPIQLRYN